MTALASEGARIIRLDILAGIICSLNEAREHHLWAQDTMRPAGPRYRDSLHANKVSIATIEETATLLEGCLHRALRARAEVLYQEARDVAQATHDLCTALCRRPAPVVWLLPRLTTRLQAKAANDVRAA